MWKHLDEANTTTLEFHKIQKPIVFYCQNEKETHPPFTIFLHTLILNPFPNKPLFFTCLQNKSFRPMWEKEKLLVMSNFSFSHSVFYLFGELSAIIIEFRIVICKLFQFGSLKFVIWERVKQL